MLVRAFAQGRSVVLASALFAGLMPAVASAEVAPPSIVAPVASLLPAAPAVPAAPLVASIASTCRGAHRAGSAKARRTAISCLVNHARGAAGLHGFRSSRPLARAATRHARDMVRARYFAHQRSGGPSLTQRARKAGFRGRDLGEAIAYGCGTSGTPAAILRMWLNSPPHRAILLSGSFRRVGIGVARRSPVACGGPGATFVLDAAR